MNRVLLCFEVQHECSIIVDAWLEMSRLHSKDPLGVKVEVERLQRLKQGTRNSSNNSPPPPPLPQHTALSRRGRPEWFWTCFCFCFVFSRITGRTYIQYVGRHHDVPVYLVRDTLVYPREYKFVVILRCFFVGCARTHVVMLKRLKLREPPPPSERPGLVHIELRCARVESVIPGVLPLPSTPSWFTLS